VSSNDDFDGPVFRPARRREADENSGGAYGGGAYEGGGQNAGGSRGRGGQYPEPEGWGDDGFWRDSSIDSDYETGTTSAVRPANDGPRDEPGYSYWADGKGWQNSPGKSARAGDATSLDATRAAFGPGGAGGAGAGAGGAGAGAPGAFGVPGDPTQMDYPGRPGGDPGYWAGGPGGPAGPGGPGSPGGPGGPGGPGPGGPGGRGPGRRGPGGPGGPGRNGKRKGSWWRHWTWKKALALTGGVFVIMMLGLFGVYEYLASNAVIPAALASANYQNTTVYYSDGKTVIGTIGPVNRQDLTFNEIPKTLQDAVLAAEDRSFWTEGGISPEGILRAAYDDLTGSAAGVNGGSTITQEFVRNYYQDVGTQQTISRKIKEIFISQKLAGEKSKQWILTNYMNLIYLGDNSYGVSAAAETYFGLPVSKLSVAQDAVIAAIIQAPSTYPQLQFRSNLIARWQYVLGGMVKMGDLTQAQASAMKFPKLLTDSGSGGGPTGTSFTANSSDPWAPYLMDVVQNELEGVDHVSVSELEYGGLKVVTTISRPMEVAMYKAVNENLADVTASGGELPSYVMVGAELQNPSNGQIIAMYPGRGQNMSAKQCQQYDCDLNTAVYTREQVGSSFKPYVLSTAVSEGMNVQTSTLNASPYLCVPPDYEPLTLSQDEKSLLTYCPNSGWFPVENDGGESGIGNPKKGNGTTVQNALAQSSNTAFTDLAHRATTSSIIRMAQNYGVNIAPFAQGGSNLSDMVGQVGLALGTASLTVNEQDQMLATIADNGVYHQAHVVKYWQQPDGPEQMPIVATHPVLDSNPTTNAQLDSQVQYAMEMTTVDGTGTAAAAGLGDREIIGKTGTTSSYHSGFFIGAIPQYALVVGMFTQDQSVNSTESLLPLGGGGFGGYWPAKIWNSFAQAEFANLPYEYFSTSNPVVFSGQAWNQVGKLPAAKKPKKTPCTTGTGGHGRRFGNPNPQCTTSPSPNPTKSGGFPTGLPTGNPTGIPTFGQPTATASATPTPTITDTGTASPTPTSTASAPVIIGGGGGGGGAGPGTSANTVKAGLAVGGVLAVLPGSLLWTTVSRRRRRRRDGADR
jgi:membrane peptidoglycan carboxypeptidase